MTLAEALQQARRQIPPPEARLLLSHVLQQNAVWLETHRDDTFPSVAASAFDALVARRAAGEPVAYLLGSREFYGRAFTVTPDVLIPRPETELLVDLVKQKVDAGSMKCPAWGTASLLDLGTGSGCIAITLALELPQCRLTAVDFSETALQVARSNATRLCAPVTFHRSDWFAALPAQKFDCIVANPPYVAAGDTHLATGDLRYEPLSALTDHADGLTAISHIIATAPRWLKAGGWLLLEHGHDQSEAVAGLFEHAGFTDIEQTHDLAGILRVSSATISDNITQPINGAPQ